MKVQAVVEEGIEIVFKGNSDWSSIDASEVTTAMVLYPTSTQDTTKWVHAQALTASAFTAAAGSYEELSLNTGVTSEDAAGYSSPTKQLASQYYDASGKQYYRLDTFQIRTVQGTATAQKVKVKEVQVTGTPAALDKSLRVIVNSGSNYYNYNAGGSTNTTRVVATEINATNNPEKVVTVTYLNNNVASEILCTCAAGSQSAADTPQDVDIYKYYEGEDVNHYSNNIGSALAELTVTVLFEVDSSLTTMTAKPVPADATAGQKAGTAAINP